MGLKMQLVPTNHFQTSRPTQARSTRLLKLQRRFLSIPTTRIFRASPTSIVNKHLRYQQEMNALRNLTHPTKPNLRIFQAVSPLPNAKGYILRYQSKQHTTARATIARLPHLLLSIQPERMTVSRKDKYHNNTTVDQHGTNSIRNQQMRDLPVPPLHPDASKGPEAVMQAIDEWFDYQDRLKALGITTHPMDRKNQPELHIASPLSLQQSASMAKALKKMPTTHETLEAKLQRTSGPLFPLTAQLLPPGNSNGPANSHLTPNAASQYQYPSQHTDTGSPSQPFTSRKLVAILTWLLNAAWDMWQDQL